MKANLLVVSAGAAKDNIARFETELAKNPQLADIMAYGRGWYATRTAKGWALGPSKFAGYADNSAKAYLSSHRDRDGRLTERALSQWFEDVEPGTALYDEVHAALRELFARYGKSPNKLLRISVLKSDIGSAMVRKSGSGAAQNTRITTDPDVCGGRPCIRGMRIRVSDVLDLLAAGNERSTILADYPYLEDGDIDAALAYASRAVDHRVIKAA
ncbi:MAG TPA: DUF433 domain-containing protein [Rhizomicrobium sp.]|jgi:uncharacterized protein (DUF433 family)